MAQRICVVGAGSWGTTVAALTSHNVDTTLWTRRAELADEINSRHTNSAYLGDSALPESLRANCDIEQAVSGADVIAMAVPSQGFHSVMNELSKFVRSGVPILSLSKGLEQSTFKRMSEVITEVMPHNPVAVLSGPNLAKEILAGQPAASVIACSNESIARELISVFSRPTFRLYTNPDVIGCEIGGVVKNVVAIGLSAGFIEPLESNGLFSVHEFLFKLIDILERQEISQFDRDMYNNSCRDLFDQFAKFVALHYALSHRDDTAYWKAINDKTFTDKYGDPYFPYIGRNDSFWNMTWRYMSSWMHPFEIGGIPFISTGLQVHMVNSYRFLNFQKSTPVDIRYDLEATLKSWEERKARWKFYAEKAPTMRTYLKETFHNENA